MSETEHRKVALITGVTGQDGSYLAELLLEKGYIVHGIKRRSSSFNQARIEHLYVDQHEHKHPRFILHYGDLLDMSLLQRIIRDIQPDEVYNLAAQSHVKVSFELPIYTCEVDGVGTLNLLEAIRESGMIHKIKFYQASTSELYGGVHHNTMLNENTPFYPRSPYSAAKLLAYWLVRNYREAYGMYGCNGILFNHESPRRGETFVTRKITMAVSRIALGLQPCLYLGNLDAERDWGHARDYVEAMWQMLQLETADDFVVATGEKHSVREFCEEAFGCVGIQVEWQGERGQVTEVGVNKATGDAIIRIDERYFRPTEVNELLGDATKARETFGWKPKTLFKDLVREMVEADLDLARQFIHMQNRPKCDSLPVQPVN
eukprot:TRINITY_DN9926_c0_g1::TRINITY_DN9926_c0_g1_i1::g.29282::m.29282 TRINITY_DN9926_c0_g1::TRINITY_DN9926_c0_g1_i1::g.29282  ORF type:complete len:387 (+),score=61.31,sp/P0AC91/GM4D_SHIFL/62.36/3e-154,Epimerase/PF01370.16/2.2e-67,RmlD_sub_bind/PF04321.12/1e-08,Polysacc_synt_2/PF02719.10/6.3e-06,Epimerase_Csub/PF13950.1/4.8e+03,Epimerase_Csub/PF13950.1/0.039,NAD_binding_10/PF13460.1/0.43,NAD_binding_10/PF13460.1/1.2e+02,NAD_binding_10/PF13460.1/1.3e+04 TRINITY_DN9926_c0_g1_i1:38-1162(+)